MTGHVLRRHPDCSLGRTLALVLGSIMMGTALHSRPVKGDTPNIVLALADDVSATEFDWLNDGTPATNRAATPHLQDMAQNGVAFRTGWSMPICGPTRGSLVTGLYAQWTGWFDNQGKPNGEENSLGRKFGTFAQLAQSKGYKVLIAGKWQMVGTITPYGYDEACLWRESDNEDFPRSELVAEFDGPTDPAGRESRYWHPFFITNGTVIPTDENDFGPVIVYDCVKDFIRRQKAANQKFLVYMPLLLPHQGYDFDLERNGWLPVPIMNRRGKIIGRESGPGSLKRNLEFQDYQMGDLLKFLKDEELHNDTISFFMGDNGTQGEGKGQTRSEIGTRVPFIVHGPSRVTPRYLSDELVSTNDIYSTVRGLVEAEETGIERTDSVDMSDYLLGIGDRIPRKWLYAYRNRARMIRNENYILDGRDDLFFCPSRDNRNCEKKSSEEWTGQERRLVARFEKIKCKLELREVVDPDSLIHRGRCRATVPL